MRERTKNLLLGMFGVGASLSLASCAADPATWQRPNTTAYDKGNIVAACRYEIAQKNLSPVKESEIFNYCMESKGFRLVGGD